MNLPGPIQKAVSLAFPGLDGICPRLRIVLVGFAFSTTAQFLFSSILVIHLYDLGLSPASVGIAGFCFYTSLRCQGLIAGALAARYNTRPVYACAVLLSVLGYLGSAFNTTFSILLISMTVLGIGLGLDALCRSVILVQGNQSKESGNRALTLHYVVFNLAASIGPLLSSASLVAGWSTQHVFLAAAIIEGTTGALFLSLFPFPVSSRAGEEKQSLQAIRVAWRSRLFRSFLIRLPLIWFVFSIMHFVVPLFLIEWIQIPRAAISTMFLWNGILVVILGYTVQERLKGFLKARSLSKFYGIALGSSLMALGIFSLLLASRRPSMTVYLFMTIFTFGELCFIPMVQAIVNDCVPDNVSCPGAYFGLASLAWGVGAGLSNLFGGIMVGVARQYGFMFLPLILGTVAMCVAANYFHLGSQDEGCARPLQMDAPSS